MRQVESLHSYDYTLNRWHLYLFGAGSQLQMNPAYVPLERLTLGECERAVYAFIGTFAGMSPIVLGQRVSSQETLATGLTKMNLLATVDNILII